MRRIAVSFILAGYLLFSLTACGLQKKPGELEAGMTAIQELKYEEALQHLEAAEKKGQNKRMIERGRGLAAMGMTDYEGAVTAFKKALSYSSGRVDDLDFDTNYYLAAASYRMGDVQGALSAYNAILELRPKEKDAYYLRGVVKLENDLYEEAIADFDKAVALDHQDYDLLIDVYTSLEENGHTEAGQTYLNAALTESGKEMNDVQAGMIAYYLGDYENARNRLEKGRESGGEQAILLLGKTYEALGDVNYAATLYTEYLEKHPDSVPVSNQLALSKMNAKDYEGALSAIEAAMKIENNDMIQVLKFNQVVAYEYLLDFKKASVLMESYLSSYPDDQNAKREFEFLKTR